jgi:hypothetical protein
VNFSGSENLYALEAIIKFYLFIYFFITKFILYDIIVLAPDIVILDENLIKFVE